MAKFWSATRIRNEAFTFRLIPRVCPRTGDQGRSKCFDSNIGGIFTIAPNGHIQAEFVAELGIVNILHSLRCHLSERHGPGDDRVFLAAAMQTPELAQEPELPSSSHGSLLAHGLCGLSGSSDKAIKCISHVHNQLANKLLAAILVNAIFVSVFCMFASFSVSYATRSQILNHP